MSEAVYYFSQFQEHATSCVIDSSDYTVNARRFKKICNMYFIFIRLLFHLNRVFLSPLPLNRWKVTVFINPVPLIKLQSSWFEDFSFITYINVTIGTQGKGDIS